MKTHTTINFTISEIRITINNLKIRNDMSDYEKLLIQTVIDRLKTEYDCMINFPAERGELLNEL